MFGKGWQTSERSHEVALERDFAIPVGDGIELVGDLFRPETDAPVPVILSASCYNTEFQSARITPRSSSGQNAWIESGDPYFYGRRGYAHAIVNVRGTGKSGGRFRNLGPREIDDLEEAIAWLASRPWCTGSVGMTGISYFGMTQVAVAQREPEALEAIFAPWSASDPYRDGRYHGGIFRHAFVYKWSQQLDNPRMYPWSKEHLSSTEYRDRIDAALDDEEIRAHPVLVEALEDPDEGVNPLLVDLTINRLDEPGGYYDVRRSRFENTAVPAYFGASWDHYRTHLPAGFRNWSRWDGPSRLLIGPPNFVDRPYFQLGFESLRWFDRWLKGVDTGIDDEPSVKLFVMGQASWHDANEWPLPETKWTPFYLHEGGVLSEREYLPREGFTTYEDSPFGRGSVEFVTPELVEQTEIVGPLRLDLVASTTAPEVLFFVTLFHREADGAETDLTKGWLRGSQRREDPDRAEPWEVYHPHDRREPVPVGEPIEYRIEVRPTGISIPPGERFGIRIASADATAAEDYYDIPHKGIQSAYSNGRHLSRQSPSRVTIHHSAAHPSRLIVPVTAGNLMGTYASGGRSNEYAERAPYAKIQHDERGSPTGEDGS